MSNEVIEILTKKGKCRMKQDGQYIDVDCDWGSQRRINIPLFHRIALFTSEKRGYKTLLTRFFDDLQSEGIECFFKTRESLQKGGRNCGKVGGDVAFSLGLFCRYYDKLPRNVNVVSSECEECSGHKEKCGTLKRCSKRDGYYGCGKNVFVPLDHDFDVKRIPHIRGSISTEIFPYPI